ncbi:hypothetical protein ONK27_27070, partial [Salmonella enterica subsp. enterica serovar Virginia]|nr:hypothetical protein [Salmonella enterica subsp. enterica serovar Virginia]
KGQVVGTIDFQLNGKSIEQRPLMVMENVEEGGFFSRMWDFVLKEDGKYPTSAPRKRIQFSRL